LISEVGKTNPKRHTKCAIKRLYSLPVERVTSIDVRLDVVCRFAKVYEYDAE
jgi:hypothetical protein